MARVNTLPKTAMTVNEVATPVRQIDNEQKLVRMTLASLLWEDNFYVDGVTHAQALASLVAKTNADFVANLAMAARSQFKLRHVPLLLARELARKSALKAETLASIIQRPDELGEFVSIYWKDKKQPLANQVKKGLALALGKFNEYQLAKWDKNSAAVRLRDVLFLTHAKPTSPAQAELFRKLAEDKLEVPNTWETRLSAGEDKKETFEDLMATKQLGALAFLRNLRNMVQAGIPEADIRSYGATINVERALPFRYIAAARIMPQFEDMLEDMMLRSLATHKKLPGKTKLFLDVSSSTFRTPVSSKSDLTRQDAILALGMLCREICEDVEIYSFSGNAMRIAPRHGFALADAVKTSQGCSGTDINRSLSSFANVSADRIIIMTDEQSTSRVVAPSRYGAEKGYIINVGSYKNGINSGEWETITGFSEAVIDYIQAIEDVR